MDVPSLSYKDIHRMPGDYMANVMVGVFLFLLSRAASWLEKT
jgi:hypothetical protein